jgi:hypothetical protein
MAIRAFVSAISFSPPAAARLISDKSRRIRPVFTESFAKFSDRDGDI